MSFIKTLHLVCSVGLVCSLSLSGSVVVGACAGWSCVGCSMVYHVTDLCVCVLRLQCYVQMPWSDHSYSIHTWTHACLRTRPARAPTPTHPSASACTRTRTRTCTPTCTRICMHAHTHAWAHARTHTHADTHTHTHLCTHAHTHTCTHACKQARTCTPARAHAHARTDAPAKHTHTHKPCSAKMCPTRRLGLMCSIGSLVEKPTMFNPWQDFRQKLNFQAYQCCQDSWAGGAWRYWAFVLFQSCTFWNPFLTVSCP